MATLLTAGAELFYEVVGEGEPWIVLHGRRG